MRTRSAERRISGSISARSAKLLDELDRRIAETDDADERARLQKFRDAVLDIGKGVVTGLLTDMARGI